MTPVRTSILFAAGALAGCAPQQIRADVGAAFVRVQGELGLQNAGGSLNLAGNMNDIRDQLAAGEFDQSPYLRLEADWGRNRVKLSGFGHNSGGGGTLAGDFGGITAGTAVTSDFDFIDVTGSWTYDLLPGTPFRVAPGVQVGYYSLDLTVRSAGGFETIDTDMIAPMPCIEASVDLGPVQVGATAGVMNVDLRDALGRYWDAEGYVRGSPWGNVELIGGLRYLLFDAHGAATGRDFDADIDVFGWFVGVGVRF